MKSIRARLPLILIESFAIFCSVLLAFGAEQWRQSINEQKQATAILDLVEAELSQNLIELERAVETREALLAGSIEALGVYIDTGSFPENLPNFDVPQITSVAYQLAAQTGAVSRIEPGDLLVIARAYEALDEVRANQLFLDNRNAQVRFRDNEQYISGFIYYANRALISEPNAIASIKEAIERL